MFVSCLSLMQANETKLRSRLDLFAGRGPEQERQRHQTSHVQTADPHGAGRLEHPRGIRHSRKSSNIPDFNTLLTSRLCFSIRTFLKETIKTLTSSKQTLS